MSDDNHDVASSTDLDAALAQAKPAPRTSAQSVRDSVAKQDSDSGDAGLASSEHGAARGSTLAAGWTPRTDPNPGSPVGTKGIESEPDEVLEPGRAIPGAYSGDPERLRDEDRNPNESKA